MGEREVGGRCGGEGVSQWRSLKKRMKRDLSLRVVFKLGVTRGEGWG